VLTLAKINNFQDSLSPEILMDSFFGDSVCVGCVFFSFVEDILYLQFVLCFDRGDGLSLLNVRG